MGENISERDRIFQGQCTRFILHCHLSGPYNHVHVDILSTEDSRLGRGSNCSQVMFRELMFARFILFYGISATDSSILANSQVHS